MQNTTETRSLRQRWQDYRLTTTQTFSIAASAVVVTLVIGFGPAGWVTSGSAEKTAAEAASNAREALASSVCVKEFMRSADASARLEKIRRAGWYERGDLVEKWATMPDEKEPSGMVASICAEKLAALEMQKTGKTTAAMNATAK